MQIVASPGLAGVVLLSLCWCTASHAQSMTGGTGALFRNDVAGTRPEPAFMARPFRLGALRADVHLSTDLRYESNILNSPDAKRSDASLALKPFLSLRSDWRRHALGVEASGEFRRYAAQTDQNSNTYSVAIDSRIDVAAGHSTISFSSGYARLLEERGAGGSVTADVSPVFLRQAEVQVVTERDFGALKTSTITAYSERRYEDIGTAAAPLDQSFRDLSTASTSVRVSFDLTRNTALFVSGTLNNTASVHPIPALRRDASGYSALIGLHIKEMGQFAAQAAIGTRARNYDLTRYKDYDGLTWDATVDWYPRPLLSLRFQSSQDFRNSNLRDVAGILVRSVSLAAFYDIRRNVRIRATAQYDDEKYREIAVNAESYTATLASDWSVTPRLQARFYVRYRDRNAPDNSRIAAFSGFTTGLTLTGYL